MAIRYEVKKDAAGEWYFTLVAANGETVMVSESYTRKGNAQRAVADVRRVAIQEALARADGDYALMIETAEKLMVEAAGKPE